VIGALVITRFAVMLFPAIATLGMFPAMRSLVIGVGNTVAAAVINALVFGVGTAVMVKAFGVLMAPGTGLPSWLVVALLLLITLVMWFALRPFQRLTAMAAPGRSQFTDAAGALSSVTRGLTRVGSRLAGSAAGAFGGQGAGADPDGQDKPGTELERVGSQRRAEVDGEAGQDDRDADLDGGPKPVAGRPLTSVGGPDRGERQAQGQGQGQAQGQGQSQGPARGGVRGPGRDPGRGSGPTGSARPSGAGGRDEEQLIAAELGLPGGGRRPGSALERSSAGGWANAGVAPGQGHGPSPRAPTRPARQGVRRSEGADMDDLIAPAALPRDKPGSPGSPGSSASSAGSEDLDGEEVFVVYRPDDPARGGRRG
jgi:hypothetical protein